MSQKNVIITKKARQNMLRARAGDINLPVIMGMAFGNGGVDSDGNVIAPSEEQSGLSNELFRKENDSYTLSLDEISCRYECTLSESELAGEFISEIGLYDADNDLVCIKTFKPKGKDNDMQMTFSLDDIF